MVGLGAAEAADPRKSLPRAIKQVFWRVSGVRTFSPPKLSRLTLNPVLSHIPPTSRPFGPIYRPSPPQRSNLRRRKSLSVCARNDQCGDQRSSFSLQRRDHDRRSLRRQFLHLRRLTHARGSRRATPSTKNPCLVRRPLPLHHQLSHS